MLQNNKIINISNLLLYKNLPEIFEKKNQQNIYPLINFLEKPNKVKRQNASWFFKNSAFVLMSLFLLSSQKYKTLKIKSTLFILWNNINAYTIIF